jgi:hypothetical protein
MIKFNMNAFLFDLEMSPADLAGKLKLSRSTITRAKDRGTVKMSFIKMLRKHKLNPDTYIGGKK